MNDKSPILTVLLISYNHVPYIARCIESVLAQQTDYPFIIRIFDDGSTDGTADVIRAYQKKFPDKIEAVIAPKNEGSQANHWNAYASVQTKYCILTETDDYWCDNEKIQLQVSALESHPECSFCSTNSVTKVESDPYLSDWDGRKEIQPGAFAHELVDWDDIERMPSGFLTHLSSRCIRTSCLQMSSLQNKETLLFDASQFFYLMTKGPMFWIDRVGSVYVKTGQGTCTAIDSGGRMTVYLRAMANLNEDTQGRIWWKIAQQLNLVADFWAQREEAANEKC